MPVRLPCLSGAAEQSEYGKAEDRGRPLFKILMGDRERSALQKARVRYRHRRPVGMDNIEPLIKGQWRLVFFQVLANSQDEQDNAEGESQDRIETPNGQDAKVSTAGYRIVGTEETHGVLAVAVKYPNNPWAIKRNGYKRKADLPRCDEEQ